MLHADQGPGCCLVVEAPRSEVQSADIYVLFAEAKRRRRRRRLLGATLSLVLAGAAAGVIVGGGHGRAIRRSDGNRPASAAKSQASRPALPSVRLAWLDHDQLMIGDPATGAVRAGPATDASPTAPLVFAAGQLFWADSNRDVAPIRDYNLTTGKIRYLQPGQAVYASPDGRHLYVALNNRVLVELPADGSGRTITLRTPAGWFMSGIGPGWEPTHAGGDIIVATSDDDYTPPSARVGLWNPAIGRVRILGIGITIFGVYTPPSARYSLIAWVRPSRAVALDYSLRITNTATGATVVARSPLHHGFVFSGAPAFSPGGTLMAAFARTGRLGSSPELSRLVIVDTSTGVVRVVPGTALYTEEDAFWATWLPGGQRVLAGALGSAYVVDARTLSARPVTFFGDSTDGFSAVVLPTPRQSGAR